MNAENKIEKLKFALEAAKEAIDRANDCLVGEMQDDEFDRKERRFDLAYIAAVSP